ncbi:MAG TPA: condensation domain-containing protein, partial [Pyrinomonadaceae bacterium]|nr:condensation domain-containing protein [Pyrinomonadaceae bacterium]
MQNVEDIYTLSPMQQGMLFHALYAPNSGAYVEQITCTFTGELNREAFREAWRRVLELHPILRTAFLWEGLDEPLQVVRQEVELAEDYQDWRALSPAGQQERLKGFLEEEREQGFELARAPLTRYTLIRSGEDAHTFVWMFHHLILDGWSLPLVLRDFFISYAAACRGEEPDAPSPRPFRDYIEWLRQQDLTAAEQFWRRTMEGFTAPTPLGVDRGANAPWEADEAAFEEARFRFSARTTAGLQEFGRRHQLTMNTLIQGAWALLLSCYSGETDVVIGATVSGRSPQLAGSEEMVGMFVNTLPVRARVEAGATVLDWLRKFQAQMVEARQYEFTPLVQLHGWSEVGRGLPLFESIVSFQNHPVGEALPTEELGLKAGPVVVYHTRTTYPLTIVAEPGEELSLAVVYDTRRFEAPVLERLAGHLEMMLSDIASDPGRRVSELNLLTPPERRALLPPPAARHAAPPDCLHHLFERRAAAD